jgi:hypothetical protein
MPHRRTIKKGSFGGNFDELVKHFSDQPHERSPRNDQRPKDDKTIHDRLFERAWREAREQ